MEIKKNILQTSTITRPWNNQPANMPVYLCPHCDMFVFLINSCYNLQSVSMYSMLYWVEGKKPSSELLSKDDNMKMYLFLYCELYMNYTRISNSKTAFILFMLCTFGEIEF